jgi:hypothetical protein
MIVLPHRRKAFRGGSSTLRNGLLAWYDFENGTTWTDSTGNGHTLTEQGTVDSVSGKVSNAADFGVSGSNGLDLTGSSSVLDIFGTNNWSLAWWFRSTTLSGPPACFGRGSEGADGWIAADLNGGYLRLLCFLGGTQTCASGVALSTDTWYFAHAYRDGSTCGVSVNNGTAGTTAVGTANDNGGLFRMGYRSGGFDGYPLRGLLDSFAFYNRTLTPTEVTQIYNSGNGISCPAP